MFWVNLLYATSTIPLSTRTEQNLKQICNNWKVINKGVKGKGGEESVCAKRNRKYPFLLSYKKVAKKIMAEKKERK
jgi:hypothetical protein